MPFEVIAQRFGGDPVADVHVSLRPRKSGFPALIVGLSAALVKRVPSFVSGASVMIEVGTLEDDGFIRIGVSSAYGIAKLRVTGQGPSALIDFGHIVQLGTIARQRLPTRASYDASGGLTVELPGLKNWRQEWKPLLPYVVGAEEDEEDAEVETSAAVDLPNPIAARANGKTVIAPAQRAQQRAADPPRPAAPDVLAPRKKPDAPSSIAVSTPEPARGATIAERNAVLVRRMDDDEYEISRPTLDKAITVSGIHGCIVAVLLVVSPDLLPAGHIAERSYRMLRRRVIAGGVSSIDYEVRNLQPKLGALGLKITHVKGIGFGLAIDG